MALKKFSSGFASIALLVFVLPVALALGKHFASGQNDVDWRSARRDSSGLAPDPATTPEAVIQVYAARAVRWRGALGVHTWIAVKPSGAMQYTRFEVMGFSVVRGGGGEAVRVQPGIADAYWFGSAPELLREVRGGAEVDAMIARLHAAARDYPYMHEYRIWPGPNSNTFIAYLGRAVPELRIDLPPTAVGKDYLPGGGIVADAPSGSGKQLSLGGVFGVLLAREEGLEVNLLGLTAGIDLQPLALKLPGLGRIGFAAPALRSAAAPDATSDTGGAERGDANGAEANEADASKADANEADANKADPPRAD